MGKFGKSAIVSAIVVEQGANRKARKKATGFTLYSALTSQVRLSTILAIYIYKQTIQMTAGFWFGVGISP